MNFYNPYGGFYGQPYGAFNNNIGNLPQFPNYTPNNQNYQVNSQQSQNTAQNQNNGLQPNNNVGTNKIYVNGIEDVKSRMTPANSSYIFLDNDNPVIYDKTVDPTGKMTVKAYQIIPVEEKPVQKQPAIDMSEFVKRTEFEKLKAEIEKFKKKKPEVKDE